MSGVELGLAIIPFIDLCFKYGKALSSTCQNLRNADSRLSESIVRIEACWWRIETQLDLVRRLTAVLDERHRQIQEYTIRVLVSKLEIADSKLNSLIKTSGSSSFSQISKPLTAEARRWKYALLKDGLADAISSLEEWQRISDPSFFLMMKVISPETDSQLEVVARSRQASKSQAPDEQSISTSTIRTANYLRRALTLQTDSPIESTIFLPPDGLDPDSIYPVPFSPVKRAQRIGNGHHVLLDPVNFVSRPNVNAVLKDIRNFSRKLQHSDPFLFGLLECKGILKDEGTVAESATGLSFVFRLPPDHQQVSSLRNILSRPEQDSISDKLTLAQQLVTAVSYVHLYGFVHKNIRPETVLLINNDNSKWRGLPGREELIEEAGRAVTAVLVGFDVLRNADGSTSRLGDDHWEHNLYRHPHRQGRTPQTDYEMRHDIYSVGVCLLEIGLWENFVVYKTSDGERDGSENQTSGMSELQSLTLAKDGIVTQLGMGLQIGSVGETGSDLLKDPLRLKDRLVQLTKCRLRHKMGTRYSKVVETCLTCLDQGNVDFGDEKEFQDEDGIAVGVRYIEKVVFKLKEIVL